MQFYRVRVTFENDTWAIIECAAESWADVEARIRAICRDPVREMQDARNMTVCVTEGHEVILIEQDER